MMGVLFAVGVEATDILADLPLAEIIQPFFKQLTILFGGIAGLYLVLILARIFYERKKVSLLRDIRYDLDQQNIHHKLNYSKDRKGWFKKMFIKENHTHVKKTRKKKK
jgi:hypothetical protein